MIAVCSTCFVRLLKNDDDVFASYCFVSNKNYKNLTLFMVLAQNNFG